MSQQPKEKKAPVKKVVVKEVKEGEKPKRHHKKNYDSY
jgi:hypothetical protein